MRETRAGPRRYRRCDPDYGVVLGEDNILIGIAVFGGNDSNAGFFDSGGTRCTSLNWSPDSEGGTAVLFPFLQGLLLTSGNACLSLPEAGSDLIPSRFAGFLAPFTVGLGLGLLRSNPRPRRVACYSAREKEAAMKSYVFKIVVERDKGIGYCHRRMRPSSPPEANQRPSGVYARA